MKNFKLRILHTASLQLMFIIIIKIFQWQIALNLQQKYVITTIIIYTLAKKLNNSKYQ
jgi:hypothetical protein